MKKIAVLMAEGFEESETFIIVEVLRECGLICHTFYFNDELVKGMQNIYIKGDKPFSDEVKNYDCIVLPGGRPGGQNLRDNPKVIEMVQYFDQKNKKVTAMCAGTIVLSDSKVITGKHVTGYTGYENKLIGGIFKHEVAVEDQNVITSQGPATPYPFAFMIAESMGVNTESIRRNHHYRLSGGK
jgi:protein deglycase